MQKIGMSLMQDPSQVPQPSLYLAGHMTSVPGRILSSHETLAPLALAPPAPAPSVTLDRTVASGFVV